MKKKILAIILAGMMALLPVNVFAVELGKDPICDGLTDELERKAAGCDMTEKDADVGNIMLNIINIVIAILGLVAILFVIIGAVGYTTSQGDPAKTKKARDTILYAILGVVLAVLAYAIVNFVLVSLFKAGGAETESNEPGVEAPAN